MATSLPGSYTTVLALCTGLKALLSSIAMWWTRGQLQCMWHARIAIHVVDQDNYAHVSTCYSGVPGRVQPGLTVAGLVSYSVKQQE